MAKTHVVWKGLTELQTLLTQLPDTATGETAKLAEAAANGAAVDIRGAYPVRTGRLRDRVKVAPLRSRSRRSVGVAVTNTAPHAHLFEFGTQARHTSIGASRGSMPPGNVFIPRILSARRRLYEQIKNLLTRLGANRVSGDA
jgi:hypothetical protein